MAITLKRQLNDDEKKIILEQHGRRCFANDHIIPDGEQVQFDHIRAFSLDGASELNNIAPMCSLHNKEKGQLPLYDFRAKLRMREFFSKGDKLTLKHLLEYFRERGDIKAFGQPIAVKEQNGTAVIESASNKTTHNVYECPTTKWKYFYATLDVDVIDSDDDEDHKIGLQPRYLIVDRVFELFRHFQNHPVMQPSIGRIANNRIRIFDGQHKIAALLWNGRRTFECKIYLDPDIRLLNQTNIAAHDNFAQVRFYSSVMVLKLGAQFGKDFEEYKKLEDGSPKSEAGFMDFLQNRDGNTLKTAEINERFRSYLYNSVLESEDNKLKRLVSAGNRGSNEKPLTIDMLKKSLFTAFLYRGPLTDSLTTDAYKREVEINNMVRLLNMLDELALHTWDAKASSNDENQRRLNRLVSSKSMMAWSEILADAVCGKLDIQDGDERQKPLYRDLSDEQFTKIRNVLARLVEWKRWSSPANDEIETILAGNKGDVKSWMKQKGLTTGYLMGAQE